MTTDERLDRIEKAIERLEGYVLGFRDETIRRLEIIEQRLDMLSATAATVDLRLGGISKAILDSGSFATQSLRDQSRARETVSEISHRVSRLEEQMPKPVNPAA